MKTYNFKKSSLVPASTSDLFSWHENDHAFERLIPPFQKIKLISRQGGIKDGGRLKMKIYSGPLAVTWEAEHYGYIAGRQFCDRQVTGPFLFWEHIHRMTEDASGGSLLEDIIEFRPPFASATEKFARNNLQRLFDYRHIKTKNDLELQKRYAACGKKRILVGGSSGMLGRDLISFLRTTGHQVVRLVRTKATEVDDAITWNPSTGQIDASKLEGFDAFIHLGGESISSGRWTTKQKKRILDSRVKSTSLLSGIIRKLNAPPNVFICASATGFYGNRGDEQLNESSAGGNGFLAEVCKQWEMAAQPALDSGIRTVNMRFGVVLTPQGGALARMLLPFRMGLGGKVGNGKQYIPWIGPDDATGAIYHALSTDTLSGPVNVVAPQDIDNSTLTNTISGILRRPAFFPVPEFVIDTLFGEMGRELLLSSTRAIPEQLQSSGYKFLFPQIEQSLRFTLGKMPTLRA